MSERLICPAIALRPSAVGGTVESEHSGGRDVAPIGTGVQKPQAVPVGLHVFLIARPGSPEDLERLLERLQQQLEHNDGGRDEPVEPFRQ